jgi:hypothetical protein
MVFVGVPVEPGAGGHRKGRYHHGRAAFLDFGALVSGALSGSRHNMAAYPLGPQAPRA